MSDPPWHNGRMITVETIVAGLGWMALLASWAGFAWLYTVARRCRRATRELAGWRDLLQ